MEVGKATYPFYHAGATPARSLNDVIHSRFQIIETDLEGVKNSTLAKVRVYILAILNDRPDHLKACAHFIQAAWTEETGLFFEAKCQRTIVDQRTASLSEIWDYKEGALKACFKHMMALSIFAKAIHDIHVWETIDGVFTQDSRMQLNPKTLETIISLQKDFSEERITKKQFIYKLIKIHEKESNLIKIAFTQIIKNHQRIRNILFQNTLIENAKTCSPVIAVCSMRQALTREQILPLRPYPVLDWDQEMDEYLHQLKTELAQHHYHFVILVPKGEVDSPPAEESSLEEIAELLEMKIQKKEMASAFDVACTLMQLLSPLYPEEPADRVKITFYFKPNKTSY